MKMPNRKIMHSHPNLLGTNTKASLLQIRLSDWDKSKLEVLAKQANISMSEWVRRAILKGERL
jgi:hypothetical protein